MTGKEPPSEEPAPEEPAPEDPAPQGPRAHRPGNALLDGVWLAVGTLTVIKVPAPRRVDRAAARTAMLIAPAVGLLPAAVAAAVAWTADELGLSSLVVAALAIGTTALMTRGLHLDGLADTADGLASSYDRGRALAVMRRGDLGPAGGVTLVLVVLGQVACLAQIGTAPEGKSVITGLVVAVVAGRVTLPVLCARGVPSARSGGLGATVIGAVPRTAAAAVLAMTCAFAAWIGGPAGIVAVTAAVTAAAVLGRRCVQRLGGLTGDVLGAGVEAGCLAALLVLAAW